MCVFLLFAMNYSYGDMDAGLEEKLSSTKEPLFVSLGSSCEVAHQLRYLGLRATAFPLDWVLSIENSQLIRMLEEDFINFTKEECLIIDNGVLLNTYYHLVLPHEGPWKEALCLETLKKFTHKYQRRIDRFKEISSFQGKVFFIRAACPNADNPQFIYRDKDNLSITEDWAIQLYQVLKNRFPDVDFTLIIMNVHTETTPMIREIAKNVVEMLYNPFLEPKPKLDLCKKTFINLFHDYGLLESLTFDDLLKADPSF